MSKIKIHNTDFIISSIINDHPIFMWLRELVQNGIEAISEYLTDNPKSIPQDVKIRCLDVNGLIYMNNDDSKPNLKNKVSILNAGGMTQQELTSRIDMGSSGKTQSLDGNYGIGAKSSVLGFSQLLFITYKNGEGYCIGLKKTMINSVDFVVDIFTQDDVTGFPAMECTDWIKQNAEYRSYDLNSEFTDTILLGNTPQQNTFTNTYGENKKEENKTHIRRELAKRYYRTPSNINILLHQSVLASSSAKDQSSYKKFITYPEAFELAKANNKNETKPINETVITKDGYKIHYYYDPECGYDGKNATNPATHMHLATYGWPSTFSGLVFKNEIYDITGVENGKWQAVAPYIGIESKFKYFRVFVEVPNTLSTDKYRTYLKRNGEEYCYSSKENLAMIFENRPQWFIDLVKNTQLTTDKSLQDKLKDLFDEYKNLNVHILGMPGKSNNGGGREWKPNPNPNPNPNPTPRDRKGGISLPEMAEANEQQIKDYGLQNSFAHIQSTDKGDKVIYNPWWSKIEAMTDVLKQDESEELWINSIIKEQFALQTGLYTVIQRSALLKKIIDFDKWQNAISSDTINLFLDTVLITIQPGIEKMINTERSRINKRQELQQAV